MSQPARIPRSHALAAYAEPLVTGRRVLVVDDASQELATCLAEMGARLVHLYDPDAERALASAADAPRGVVIRALPPDEFDVRDGAYDLAIIPDLGLAADPAALLARVRRLVGSRGVALVAARNPEAAGSLVEGPSKALDYYELYDMVSLQFEQVRMVGEVPFFGVALAELGATGEPPEVSVDTQLAPEAGPPEVCVAVASQTEARLGQYVIVQLPPPVALDDLAPVSQRAALAEAQLRASVLASQLEELRRRPSTPAVDATHEKRIQELEATVEESNRALKEAEARAADHYVRAERAAHDLRQLEEELARQRERGTRLTHELEDERRQHAHAEVELAMLRKAPEVPPARLAELEESLRAAERTTSALRQQLEEAEVAGRARAESAERSAEGFEAELSVIAEAHAAELAQLEAVLRERAQAFGELEHEVLRRERLVRELVATLEEAQRGDAPDGSVQVAVRDLELARGEVEAIARELEARTLAARDAEEKLAALRQDNDELRGKLDALAMEAARREGEVTTSGWRIAELEQQLGAVSTTPGAKTSTPEPARSAIEDELTALRQALTQEHEARLRAESGEALDTARAELARQATLIEQLSRELDAHDRLRVARGEAPAAEPR